MAEKWQISTLTAPKPLDRFWWNSNLRTISSLRKITQMSFGAEAVGGLGEYPVCHCTEKTISGVHVSPGSAETLVMKGGITNHHSIACSLSSISAKNCRNQ